MNDEAPPRSRWVWYAAGVALMAYAAFGLLTSASAPAPLAWARFAVAGVVGHDLVLAALTALGAAALARVVPTGARPYVTAGAVVSAVLVLVALPFVLGRGRRDDVPSALPLDYGTGLAWTLLAVWVGVALVALTVWLRRRGPRPGTVDGTLSAARSPRRWPRR